MRVVLVAVVIGIALRFLFLLLAPFDNGQETRDAKLLPYNDERAHYNYIVYIIEKKTLPVSSHSIKEGFGNTQTSFESYQPPLYYLIAAPAVALWQSIDSNTDYLAARITSLLFGILLLPLAYVITLQSGLSRTIASSVLIVTSLLGSIVRFSVLVSNESLCWLFAGLMVFFWLQAEVNSSSKRYLLFWTLALAGGLYAKSSILLLAPLPLILSLLKRDWRKSAIWLGLLAIAAILTAPVWLRNIHVFGSILPLSAGFGTPDIEPASLISVFAYALRSFIFPWQEFWGGPLVGILILVIAIACAILIILSLSEFRALKLISSYFLLLFASIFGFIWLNMHYFQAEGRYLLIAWPAWIMLLAIGGRTRRTQGILFVLMLLPYLLFLVPFGE
ncbi:glycosyltransferase family 39 protein [bacterium]|nr:glycosyltransferase family 39 protein [bacterium]